MRGGKDRDLWLDKGKLIDFMCVSFFVQESMLSKSCDASIKEMVKIGLGSFPFDGAGYVPLHACIPAAKLVERAGVVEAAAAASAAVRKLGMLLLYS